VKLPRRQFLHLAAGAAALPTIFPTDFSLAQSTPHVKGPLVWLDKDQKDLDDAYTQSVYAPNMQAILERCIRNGQLMRERIGAPKRFAYGPSAIEGLDVFPAKMPYAPVHVHIHGGAWRAGLARDYHYPAEMFVNAGANFVVPDFNNVIELGGDLMAMADQARRAVAWAYKNAGSYGGDPDRFYISGHSSGGHWVGVLLTTDWQKNFGLSPTFIKGAVAGSGIFDLKPVRLSVRSSYIKFTDEMEQALSAQRHIDKLVSPLWLVYGTQETPEFQRQSRDFHAALKVAGMPVMLSVMEGYNHFEVMEQLGNPYSLFASAILNQMNLRAT
jgi:arylformamidase